MSNKPVLSAKKIIKVLIKKFNFFIVSQKGSHIKLKNKKGEITIVPNHTEISHGTLTGILNLAKISEDDFWKKYYE
jgi:predicted RNA binding protein YcfA (HicA-like mRNA interferase family)